MQRSQILSVFLKFLAHFSSNDDDTQLPSLNEISKQLGISISVLREQLEVAKALGFVEVRPRTGIRRQPYSFFPAVQQSLSYALELTQDNFKAYADLRNRLEAVFWEDAVRNLTQEDLGYLSCLVDQAWEKLRGEPVKIPHDEHRKLHMGIFKHLDNPYVIGILEAYWDAYEAIGLSMYTDYNYLHLVWKYHQQMIDAIAAGDPETGYQALVAHKDLLFHRNQVTTTNIKF